MRFASRSPRALVLAFAPSLLGAAFILQCSSDGASPSAGGDGGTKGPKSDGGITTIHAGEAGNSPTIVRVDDVRDAPVSADLGPAVDANNAFAIDLYRQALSLASGGNFVTSPFSANLALTMTYAGAVGETKTQMATVLHAPTTGPSIFDGQNALSQAVIGRAATALMEGAAENEDGGADTGAVEVGLVNEVWGQTGYTWQTPFLTTLAKSYGTGVYAWDFAGDAAGGESAINQWVSQETDGEIDPLLPPSALTDLTRMVLVNALHVKLPWEAPFDPDGTTTATFTRTDGSMVQAPFMSQYFMGGVGYSDTSDATFVSVPLAARQMSMVFGLPKADLATLTAALTANGFVAPRLASDDALALSLPKFSFTTATFSLKKSLEALGMTDAFGSAADFTGVCAHPPDDVHLEILDVLQRAALDVNENGVDATAATSVILGDDSGADDDGGSVINVTFNKPFVVAVIDASGAILFLGQVTDPTAGG